MRCKHSMSENIKQASLRLGLIAVALLAFNPCGLVLAGLPRPIDMPGSSSAALDCGGDACGQVSLTWDENKQQYRAHNSSDRWVRVSVANLAADVNACIGPGKEEYLSLKNAVTPYHANYGQGCSAPPSVE